jgi:hypothetical protein
VIDDQTEELFEDRADELGHDRVDDVFDEDDLLDVPDVIVDDAGLLDEDDQ